jgi:hypothetical protein
MTTKMLIIRALVQVVSIGLGVCLGYLAFLYAVSILDQEKYLVVLYGSDQ